jgi:hypothetical protein
MTWQESVWGISLVWEDLTMPTIPELLRDHVSLDIECVDRVYLNGYVPTLQTSGTLVYFLQHQRAEDSFASCAG